MVRAGGAVLVSSDETLLGYRGPLDLTVSTPGAFWLCWRRSLDTDEGETSWHHT